MTTRQDIAAHKRARKAGIASFIGTTIEWYDFYAYGIAAALVFGKIFFPADLNPGTATLLSFLTLWAGFIARPIGGIIFGHLYPISHFQHIVGRQLYSADESHNGVFKNQHQNSSRST